MCVRVSVCACACGEGRGERKKRKKEARGISRLISARPLFNHEPHTHTEEHTRTRHSKGREERRYEWKEGERERE